MVRKSQNIFSLGIISALPENKMGRVLAAATLFEKLNSRTG
jgi:hypothetical protein